jgi:uncharacterized protein YukE
MADIDLSYETIQATASTLTAAANNISPQITTLQSRVNGLLQPDGGFWMNQTAPAIQTQYNQFNSAATQCVQAINDFANMFNNFVQSMQSMDAKSAYQVLNPPQQSSGN